MGKIYDMVRDQTLYALQKEAFDESTENKPITVRLPENYIRLADKIAASSDNTRQSLLYSILIAGIEDAMKGHASAFVDPQEVINSLMLESGFDARVKIDSDLN